VRPRLITRRQFIGEVSAAAALALLPWPLRAAYAPDKKLGVALVGLGSYSTHQLGPALRRTRLCRLAGVVTGDAAKGRRWAQDYGFSGKSVYGYDTMARLADDPAIDIVYVVTPNGLHAEHSVAAARAGKHVICEKPMANTVAECDAIIAACKTAGVQLSIGYRLHFEPHNLEFLRIAREKEFGPLMHLQGANGFRMGSEAAAYSAWRLNKKLAGGGPLMDMGVYVIQAASMAKVEEAPVALTAKFDPVERPELFREVEESVRWTMEFADGASARCQATYAENVSWFRAEGAGGWAELGEPAFYYSGQNLKTSTGPRNFPAVNHQVAQMDGIVADLLAGRPSRIPGEMGRRDMAVVEAIYASAQAGGRRVEVKA
jgi:glucose-fructose oxidoreductase